MADRSMRAQLQSALRAPFAGPGWAGKLLIGAGTTMALEALFALVGYFMTGDAGIALAPAASAVNLPLLGYALEVFRGGLAGAPGSSLPPWGRWGVLAGAGLLVALLGTAYSLLPLLLVLAGFNLLVRGGCFLPMAVSLIVLGLLAALAALFFLPMGIARYLTEGRIEAAFRPRALWAGIAGVLGEYVAAYGVGVGAFALAGLMASVPIAGAAASPFVAFVFLVVQARLFGEICGQALRPPAQRTPAAG